MPDVGKIEVQHNESSHHYHRCQSVGEQRAAQSLTCFGQLLAPEQTAHDRRKAVGESRTGDDNEVHDVVDERGSTQFAGAMVAHHHSVGKTENNHSQLTYHNRYADR